MIPFCCVHSELIIIFSALYSFVYNAVDRLKGPFSLFNIFMSFQIVLREGIRGGFVGPTTR